MLAKNSKIVLLLIITELCIGGGGRLIAVGPVSLRMILFCIAMMLVILMQVRDKSFLPQYWKILASFLLVILIGIVFGLINYSPPRLLWEDVKPLLYFFILPFFALTIDKQEIINSSRIIKISTPVIAGLFFVTLILVHSNAIPFITFYRLTANTEEFFYRGELTFFYKGFLFLGIGLLFYYFSDCKKKYVFISILILAIVLSVTRGFLFSLAITFAVYFVREQKYSRVMIIAMMGLIIVIWGNKGTINFSRLFDSIKNEKSYEQSDPNLLGVRTYSDEGRIQQVNEVVEKTSISSFFVGHGFGQGISSRPIHMEIAYLEVFHKQGLVGLAFWGIVAWMILVAYLRSDQSSIANAFFYSSIFVFTQSATNQYFNNPIGMSVLLLSLVCLDKLKNSI
jgi:hypothetical protein